MRDNMFRLGGALLAALLLTTACAGDDAGQDGDGGSGNDGSGALEGERVEFVVPVSPGGGFDTAARLIAPYLEKHSGAQVAVVNEPGAGTLLATNNTYTAPPDGTRIQIMHSVGILAAELAGAEGVQYESADFSWIGRIDAEPHLLNTSEATGITSFDDMVASEDPVSFVAAGSGSSEYVNALVLGEVFDMEVEVITGFEGGPEAWTAVLRGDADGHIRTLTSSLEAVEAGDGVPLLLIGEGEERDAALPDTPVILERERAEDSAELLEAHLNLLAAGRAIAGPPGMEDELLEAWRAAFDAAAADPEFLQDVEDAGRPLHILDGEETQALFESLADAPEEYRELLRQSYEEQ